MVTLGWFVCPSVSMVTTSKATGLERTTVYSVYSGHVYSGHSDIVATFPGKTSLWSV